MGSSTNLILTNTISSEEKIVLNNVLLYDGHFCHRSLAYIYCADRNIEARYIVVVNNAIKIITTPNAGVWQPPLTSSRVDRVHNTSMLSYTLDSNN